MAPAKVFVLVNGQGLALHQAGADAVGALPRLAPVRAQPQPGLLEHLALGGGSNAVEDHAAGIGQQYRVPGTGELLVQAVHFVTGDFQHLLQTLAAFKDATLLKHGGGDGLRGVKVVVLQATLPGADDRRVTPLRAALGDINDLPCMTAQISTVHFLLFSALSRRSRARQRQTSLSGNKDPVQTEHPASSCSPAIAIAN